MESFKPLLTLLSGHYGWLPAAMGWMGAIRVPLKFVSAGIQARLTAKVAEMVKSPDPEDYAFIDRILSSRWYRLPAFIIDLVFSFKLPTHGDVLSMRAVVNPRGDRTALPAELPK